MKFIGKHNMLAPKSSSCRPPQNNLHWRSGGARCGTSLSSSRHRVCRMCVCICSQPFLHTCLLFIATFLYLLVTWLHQSLIDPNLRVPTFPFVAGTSIKHARLMMFALAQTTVRLAVLLDLLVLFLVASVVLLQGQVVTSPLYVPPTIVIHATRTARGCSAPTRRLAVCNYRTIPNLVSVTLALRETSLACILFVAVLLTYAVQLLTPSRRVSLVRLVLSQCVLLILSIVPSVPIHGVRFLSRPGLLLCVPSALLVLHRVRIIVIGVAKLKILVFANRAQP